MATGTNLEQDLARANDRAAQCRWIGDYDGALFWEQEAATYLARIDLITCRSSWDALKGSPDTSRLGHG